MFAQGTRRCLCLAVGGGFARTSVGYFATSDLWQDFDRNGAMTWTFTDAGAGFVVLSGELPDASGLLALAFAGDATAARALAEASLNTGIIAARDDEHQVTDLRFTGGGPVHLRRDALPERGPHPGCTQRRGHRILRRCREERAHRLHR